MLESLIMLASKVASIVDQKEKTKYLDELLSIHKELQNEEIKNTPDDGRISFLHQRLMRLTTVLGDSIVPKNT